MSSPQRWTVATVDDDLWLDPGADPREQNGYAGRGDERTVLLDYLRRYRLTLELKCADLDAAQLARRSVPPSTMSLLGLIRHMAEVERSWFRRALDAGADSVPPLFAGPDADFDGAVATDECVAEAFAAWRDEIAFAEQFTETHDLDFTNRTARKGEVQLRDIVVHMIEEYARHCGHADLLRETVDGRVGQ